MDLVITILGWIALGVISAYLLAIVGKIIFDAATADYKLYKHVRLYRKRLLRQRHEDYAWLLLQLEKDIIENKWYLVEDIVNRYKKLSNFTFTDVYIYLKELEDD